MRECRWKTTHLPSWCAQAQVASNATQRNNFIFEVDRKHLRCVAASPRVRAFISSMHRRLIVLPTRECAVLPIPGGCFYLSSNYRFGIVLPRLPIIRYANQPTVYFHTILITCYGFLFVFSTGKPGGGGRGAEAKGWGPDEAPVLLHFGVTIST